MACWVLWLTPNLIFPICTETETQRERERGREVALVQLLTHWVLKFTYFLCTDRGREGRREGRRERRFAGWIWLLNHEVHSFIDWLWKDIVWIVYLRVIRFVVRHTQNRTPPPSPPSLSLSLSFSFSLSLFESAATESMSLILEGQREIWFWEGEREGERESLSFF